MAAADTSAGYEGQVRVGAPLGQRAVVKPDVVAAGGDAGSDSAPGISANPAPGIWARA
jgi:hypothetical protein